MTQLELFRQFTVHCFFGWCEHRVVADDPYRAHAEMEAHYRSSHAGAIASLASTL